MGRFVSKEEVAEAWGINLYAGLPLDATGDDVSYNGLFLGGAIPGVQSVK
jgi:hypothetical protein